MNDTPPESTSATDLETTLLLANVESALRSLEKGSDVDNQQGFLQRLETALHMYGSVKHLLPKLNLSAEQRAVVEKQLHELRARIIGRT